VRVTREREAAKAVGMEINVTYVRYVTRLGLRTNHPNPRLGVSPNE